MNGKGELEPGDIFQTVTRDVWYVDTITASGAYCIHLSAHPAPITTKKKVTKVVNRHFRNRVFSRASIVDLVDRAHLNSVALTRRIKMARKEGEVEGTEAASGEAQAAKPAKERTVQKYVRGEKSPEKELRGQAAEVLKALNDSAGTPKTAKELADMCVFAGSRQDKERVAGFYLSQFKKKGFVTVQVEAAPAA